MKEINIKLNFKNNQPFKQWKTNPYEQLIIANFPEELMKTPVSL